MISFIRFAADSVCKLKGEGRNENENGADIQQMDTKKAEKNKRKQEVEKVTHN